MRDWASTLFPTSYDGVPFWVETETAEGGRRLVIHEIAGSDVAVIEDFGGSSGLYSVTAYTIGDTADIACAALIAALSAGGQGLVILPADGPVMVWPRDWRRSREKDREGHFAIEITFVAPTSLTGYALAIGMIANAFAAGLGAAASALGRAF